MTVGRDGLFCQGWLTLWIYYLWVHTNECPVLSIPRGIVWILGYSVPAKKTVSHPRAKQHANCMHNQETRTQEQNKRVCQHIMLSPAKWTLSGNINTRENSHQEKSYSFTLKVIIGTGREVKDWPSINLGWKSEGNFEWLEQFGSSLGDTESQCDQWITSYNLKQGLESIWLTYGRETGAILFG